MNTLTRKPNCFYRPLIILMAIVSALLIPVEVVFAAYSQVANKYMGLGTNAHFYMGLNGFNANYFMGQAGNWNFGQQSYAISSVGLLNIVPLLFIAAIVIIALNMAMAGHLDLKSLVWMAVFIFIGFALLIVINGGLRLIGVF